MLNKYRRLNAVLEYLCPSLILTCIFEFQSSLHHLDKKTQQSLIHSADLVPETAVPPCKLDASRTSVHSRIHSFSQSLSHPYDMDVGCYSVHALCM